MAKRKSDSYVFNAPVQGFQAGDRYGDTYYTQQIHSDSQVLGALQELLQSPGLWAEPQLETARPVIQAAVDSGNVDDPARSVSLSRLPRSCPRLFGG